MDVDNELRRAVVHFDTLAGEEADAEVLDALAEHRVRLQGAVGRQARIRRTPELTFRPDEVERRAGRVEQILRELDLGRGAGEGSAGRGGGDGGDGGGDPGGDR